MAKSLKDRRSSVRIAAARELAKFGKEARKAVKGLTALLEDNNPDVRGAAAMALGAIGKPAHTAVPKLSRALKDRAMAQTSRGNYAEVSAIAAAALRRIDSPAAREALAGT